MCPRPRESCCDVGCDTAGKVSGSEDAACHYRRDRERLPMRAKLDSRQERTSLQSVRALADQAFSRAAGAPLIEGNYVQLLRNARENYPAWLDAIDAAKRHIFFESYIIHEDDIGSKFADALIAKA